MKKAYLLIPILITVSAMFAGCSREEPMNILLITLDTTRADHLGCYGDEKAMTPILDNLASRGLLYENAYCQVPLTLPSHASILTGLQPPDHGIRLNGAYRLPDNIPTIAETLKGKGYDTAAFVSAFVLNSQFGLDRGFDVYDDNIVDSPELYIPERNAEETSKQALQWLKNRQDGKKPFFLWVHFFDPHMPYDPPEHFAKGDAYDGEIAFVDSMIGNIVQSLNGGDSTLLIVVGDHGESLGEHGEATHALFVYDSTLHVPLIVKLPDSMQAKYPDLSPGTRISRQVETIDIVPTIIEMVGIEKSHKKMTGQSLLSTEGTGDRVCYAESLYPLSLGWSPLQTVRNDDWKYIVAPEDELYKTSDHGELTNLADANEPVTREMTKRLRSYPVMSENTDMEQEGLAPDVAKNLRDLGYVSTGSVKRTPEELLQLADPKSKVDVFDRINKARRLSNLGEFQESVDMLKPILDEEAGNPEVNHILGAAYIRLGQYDEGLKYLTRYNELAEGDLQAMFYLGVAYLRSGSPEMAMKSLQGCVELMPSYSEAWDQLGVAQGMLGNFAKALEANLKAVETDPSNADYQKNLGVTYLRVNDAPKAEEAFRKAVEMRPDDASFHLHLGLALNRTGKPDQAVPELKSALELEPDNIEAKERLIESYFRMGKKDDACTLAEELERKGTLGSVSSFYYGVILLERDQHDKGIPMLKKAVEEMPGYAPAYEALAVGLVEKKDAENAKWLQQKLKQNGIVIDKEVATALEALATD